MISRLTKSGNDLLQLRAAINNTRIQGLPQVPQNPNSMTNIFSKISDFMNQYKKFFIYALVAGVGVLFYFVYKRFKK